MTSNVIPEVEELVFNQLALLGAASVANTIALSGRFRRVR
jgi:hypothetical protein